MQPINLKVENIDKVVMATCVLHIFLRSKRGENYIPMNQYDNLDNASLGDPSRKNSNLINLQKGHNRHSSESSKSVRDLLKIIFATKAPCPGKKTYLVQK